MSPGERMIAALLREAHLATPHDVPDVVARSAAAIGAREAAIYVADVEQVHLVPVPGRNTPSREPLVIDATLAGLAYRAIEVLDVGAGGGRHVWLPLLDGMERIGVLGVTVDELDERTDGWCRLLASLVGQIVVAKRSHSDAYARLTRSRVMSLQAEMQWALMPPTTHGTDRVIISGLIEPAYEVGGDAFDSAFIDGGAYIAVFDAMGHDLSAGLIASVAAAAFRTGRRRGQALPEIAAAIDGAIGQQFRQERFVTGLLAHLDLGSGLLRWVNCGHPAPLLLRSGKVVKTLGCPPVPPMGLGLWQEPPLLCEESLEPGDLVLCYTDGVVEARSPDGEMFGAGRLADFVIRQAAAGLTAPETLRRLIHAILDHHRDRLLDDATVLFVHWASGTEQRFLL
jgi:hypothetical protein